MCDKKIGQYEEAKVEFPLTMSSGEMGPCITIGIYDTKNKNVYMRHQPNAEYDNAMEDFIKKTILEFPKEDAKVYVCGGSYDIDCEFATKKSVLESRRHVKSIVLKYFDSKQVTVRWIRLGQVSELLLDTSKGKFKVKIHHINIDYES